MVEEILARLAAFPFVGMPNQRITDDCLTKILSLGERLLA
jgi:hypothetical protein